MLRPHSLRLFVLISIAMGCVVALAPTLGLSDLAAPFLDGASLRRYRYDQMRLGDAYLGRGRLEFSFRPGKEVQAQNFADHLNARFFHGYCDGPEVRGPDSVGPLRVSLALDSCADIEAIRGPLAESTMFYDSLRLYEFRGRSSNMFALPAGPDTILVQGNMTKKSLEAGRKPVWFLLSKNAVINGYQVLGVEARFTHPDGSPVIGVALTDEGDRAVRDAVRQNPNLVLAAVVGRKVYTLLDAQELLRSKIEVLDDRQPAAWLSNALQATHFFHPWLPDGDRDRALELDLSDVLQVRSMMSVGVACEPDSMAIQYVDRELAQGRLHEDARDLGLCLLAVWMSLLVVARTRGVWLGFLVVWAQAVTLTTLKITGARLSPGYQQGFILGSIISALLLTSMFKAGGRPSLRMVPVLLVPLLVSLGTTGSLKETATAVLLTAVATLGLGILGLTGNCSRPHDS